MNIEDAIIIAEDWKSKIGEVKNIRDVSKLYLNYWSDIRPTLESVNYNETHQYDTIAEELVAGNC
jgi:hypothetical protein